MFSPTTPVSDLGEFFGPSLSRSQLWQLSAPGYLPEANGKERWCESMMSLLLLAAILVAPQEDLKQLQAVFDTTAGTFIIEFYPDQAPNHVRRFIDLARQGFYKGTTFHSMVPHGIVQGGDPETKNPQARAKYGTGGFNLDLRPEFSSVPFAQGTVAATLLPGDPNSAGSEFLLLVTDQPQFAGQLTAFGHIVEGIDVVDKISTTPVDDRQIANERIEISDITIRP